MECRIKIALIATWDPMAPSLVQEYALPEDQAHASRKRHPMRRAESLLGRALLRRELERRTSEVGTRWRLLQDQGGPVVIDAKRVTHVSVSHSQGLVAVALSGLGRIGVDIEVPKPGRSYEAMADALMGGEEGRPGYAPSDSFLRAWTLREAIAKAEGKGIERALSISGTDLAAPDDVAWRVQLDGRPWVLGHRNAGPLHVALALEGSHAPPELGTPLLALALSSSAPGSPEHADRDHAGAAPNR